MKKYKWIFPVVAAAAVSAIGYKVITDVLKAAKEEDKIIELDQVKTEPKEMATVEVAASNEIEENH